MTQKILNFGELRKSSIAACGFSFPHMRTPCSFTFPWRWNGASSLQFNFSAKLSSSECCCNSVQNCRQWVLPSWVRACGESRLYGFTRRRLQRGWVVAYPPLDLLCQWKAPLTISTFFSLAFCDAQQQSHWNFSYYCLMLFLIGEPFPNLILKLRFTATIECIRAYWSTQQAFSSPVAAISLNLLPWRPPTKLSACSMYEQINLWSYSSVCVSGWNPFWPILWNVSGNYEKSCIYVCPIIFGIITNYFPNHYSDCSL